MQADFTHVRRGRNALLAFVATLGYSRASYVRFTTDETAATLCDCVREALSYFGGVPSHVLFDNAGTVVVERDEYGEGQHRWQRLILALAEEYGFTIRLCRPYRAKTNARPLHYRGCQIAPATNLGVIGPGSGPMSIWHSCAVVTVFPSSDRTRSRSAFETMSKSRIDQDSRYRR